MAKENRDRVSIRTDASTGGTLVHTRDLDKFEFPKGQPDPRGWEVRSPDGTKLGKVEDLLFDTAERRIRYIEVALVKDIAKTAARDYALVPIGQAQLDDADDDVIVDLSAPTWPAHRATIGRTCRAITRPHSEPGRRSESATFAPTCAPAR